MTSIEVIEHAAATAWPTIERASLGEWVLSAGDGFSRRRNSVVPSGPLPNDLAGHQDDAAAWYGARGLPTLFRITPVCDPPADDDALAHRGFSLESPVLVMTRSLPSDEMSGDIVASSTATDEWISTELEAFEIDRSLCDPWLAAIRSVPAPASFVMSMQGATPAGAGFGVIVDGLLGVFEMAVPSGDRCRGYAKRMMSALHSFGYREGAEQAFLEVVEDDDAAVGLYRSVGYEVSHRYWYRRAGVEGS